MMRTAVFALSVASALSACDWAAWNAACDLDGANLPWTRYCSGDCNAATTAAAASCNSSKPEENSTKTGADNVLSMCNGCSFHWANFAAACDVASIENYHDRFCVNATCSAALAAMSTGCDADVAAEANQAAAADSYLGFCSGCMSHYSDFGTVCGMADNQDVSFSPAEVADRFCSGECNTVATAISTDCDANDANEAPLKSQVDTFLGFCSGCMSHAIKLNTTCGLGGGDDLTTGDMSRFCSGECNAVLKGVSDDCEGNEDVVETKTVADDFLAYCSGSGCLYHFHSVPAACGNKMEATSATDQDRFCRGDCNAAITAASTGCDAAVASEVEHKAVADSYLDYCRNPTANRPAVVLTLTASGVPSDYEDTTALASSIAALAGVDVSFVTITVAAGSVVITARITAPAGKKPAEIESAMKSALGTASAATAALGITVEAAPAVLMAEDTPTPDESSGSGRGAQPGLFAPFVLGLAGVLALAR